MKKNIFFYLFIVSIAASAQNSATSLYMPFEFQNAYNKGTRNYDGTVSQLYWQNHADYNIKAKIDPKKKILSGSADIIYYNDSPDSLGNIVIHTYPDYYKKGSAKAGFFQGEYNSKLESDGMVIDLLTINGKTVNLQDPFNVYYSGTNYRIYLDQVVNPKSTLNIQVKWHYTIPGKGFERSGAIDPTSMFIGYWYPEIAVRDDIDDWDEITYDASAEFYHDNSNFEVELEVPKNYLVWASVAPSNPNEIYPDFILTNIEKAKKSNTSVPIVTEIDLKKKLKMKSGKWKFTAKNFPDFAFAMSDHFVWDAASYQDENGTYFLNSAYNPQHTGFKEVVNTEQEAIKLFHTEFPKAEFPFHHFTIFNGLEGGGMEFPGMANDQEISADDWFEWTGEKKTDFEVNFGLSLHEMCHMYYPFLMGINEKKYGWMDEGWASFSEFFIDGESKNDYPYSYLGNQTITPMMTPTYTQPQVSGTNSYDMGSFSYYSLYYLLGEELFSKCMKEYIHRWNHKHPTPYDFFFTFNDVSSHNLNWFWQNWYFDWGYPEIGIKEFKNQSITIENTGRKAIAFTIIITMADDTEIRETISPIVWRDNNIYIHNIDSKMINTNNPVKSIQLNTLTGSDAVKENNYWNGN
jgi:hypothetical protein